MPQPEAREIPGGRLIRKFPSDMTLWQVLRQFESGDASAGRNVNITARGVAGAVTSGAGQLYYEMPVLNIMGRELAAFQDFQKTLSQLGHNSGNVLVRLSYRKTDQTLFEAMEQISQFFKHTDEQSKKEGTSAAAKDEPQQESTEQREDTPMADAAAQPPASSTESQAPLSQQQQPTDSSTTTGQSTPQDLTPSSDSSQSKDPYQPVSVFLAPSGNVPAAALHASESESDFTPSIAHAQLHQARLQESSRNKRLLSDKEIEDKAAAEAARLAAIKSVLVKVRFPDNTSSDWQVGPRETGAFLYEAVRHVMADAQYPFHLVLPGGKTVIQDDASPKHGLIKGYKLSGRVLVNLVWDDVVPPQIRKQPFLKTTVAQQGQAVKVPEVPKAVEDGKAAHVQPPKAERGEGSGEGGGGKKVPKWFKFGKK